LDALYRPAAGKPFVLEDLCFGMGTSVASALTAETIFETRKSCTGQVLPSAKYRPTRLVLDAALRRIGKSRHSGHKSANISGNCERI